MGFAAASATAADPARWRAAAAECVRRLGDAAGQPGLGFLYVTDALAGHLGEIAAHLRGATAVRDWVGTVGLGIVAGEAELFEAPALTVLVAPLAPGSYRLIDAAGGAAPPGVAIVHADPRHDDLPGAVERIAADGAFVLGGLSSSRGRMAQLAGEVAEGTVSGVWLSPDVAVATGQSQGCSPIGVPRTITAAQHNVIRELDGRPALDVFKQDIGELLARRLERVGGLIHVSFPVAGSDTGDYLVRNLVGIDPGRGWIAVGELVEPGRTVRFVRRDRGSAEEDLGRMLARLRGRLGGTPRAGIYFTCLARGPSLFGPNSEEVAIVRRELGDFPLVGMFCNGEISNARLYGYTGVLALFL